MKIQPSENLLRARRALEELPFYQLVDDWVWYESVQQWVLLCRITLEYGGHIPAKTDWFILVDDDYPWGEIEFHPAKIGGLDLTFPHQSFNAIGKMDIPWREGKICAQTSLRYLGRHDYDIEPFGVNERLWWRVLRAKEWLDAASTGQLVNESEPFELPDFPRKSPYSIGLGFIEDDDSFLFWQQQSATFGYANVIYINDDRWAIIASFSDDKNRLLRSVEYGGMLNHHSMNEDLAFWILLSDLPVIPPWQPPVTFGELRGTLAKQGVNFNELVFALSSEFRDGKKHFLFLGFPVPEVFGGKPSKFHWQGLRMPLLSHGNVKGFRPIENSYVVKDANTVLADTVPIDWVTSRNWAEDQIRTRGRASFKLTKSKIILIGGGAIGSSIAEILVREGCQRLTVIDGEFLEIGNLCRHTLSLRHIQIPKAISLAARLNCLSPHVTVESIPLDFKQCSKVEQNNIAESDIVIDCTGDDRVSYLMSKFPWAGSKLFVSVSLGLQAQRLFVFAVQGENFPHNEFMNRIGPWLEKEMKENKGFKLPREGIGCWSPVFPARSDDIWLMSSIATKCIDVWASISPHSPCMRIYEQELIDGLPFGVKLVAD